MVDKTIVKIGLLLAVLVALIGFWQWQISEAHQAGYDKARVEMLNQYQNDLDTMLAAKNLELDIVIEHRDKWRATAIELQSKKPKEVKVYVDKIIENNPDCSNINGASILLNSLRDNFTE